MAFNFAEEQYDRRDRDEIRGGAVQGTVELDARITEGYDPRKKKETEGGEKQEEQQLGCQEIELLEFVSTYHDYENGKITEDQLYERIASDLLYAHKELYDRVRAYYPEIADKISSLMKTLETSRRPIGERQAIFNTLYRIENNNLVSEDGRLFSELIDPSPERIAEITRQLRDQGVDFEYEPLEANYLNALRSIEEHMTRNSEINQAITVSLDEAGRSYIQIYSREGNDIRVYTVEALGTREEVRDFVDSILQTANDPMSSPYSNSRLSDAVFLNVDQSIDINRVFEAAQGAYSPERQSELSDYFSRLEYSTNNLSQIDNDSRVLTSMLADWLREQMARTPDLPFDDALSLILTTGIQEHSDTSPFSMPQSVQSNGRFENSDNFSRAYSATIVENQPYYSNNNLNNIINYNSHNIEYTQVRATNSVEVTSLRASNIVNSSNEQHTSVLHYNNTVRTENSIRAAISTIANSRQDNTQESEPITHSLHSHVEVTTAQETVFVQKQILQLETANKVHVIHSLEKNPDGLTENLVEAATKSLMQYYKENKLKEKGVITVRDFLTHTSSHSHIVSLSAASHNQNTSHTEKTKSKIASKVLTETTIALDEKTHNQIQEKQEQKTSAQDIEEIIYTSIKEVVIQESKKIENSHAQVTPLNIPTEVKIFEHQYQTKVTTEKSETAKEMESTQEQKIARDHASQEEITKWSQAANIEELTEAEKQKISPQRLHMQQETEQIKTSPLKGLLSKVEIFSKNSDIYEKLVTYKDNVVTQKISSLLERISLNRFIKTSSKEEEMLAEETQQEEHTTSEENMIAIEDQPIEIDPYQDIHQIEEDIEIEQEEQRRNVKEYTSVNLALGMVDALCEKAVTNDIDLLFFFLNCKKKKLTPKTIEEIVLELLDMLKIKDPERAAILKALNLHELENKDMQSIVRIIEKRAAALSKSKQRANLHQDSQFLQIH